MPKTKQNLSKVTQLRVTESMYEVLERLSLDEDRPMANLIRVLLDEALYYRQIGMSKRLAKAMLAKLGINEPV